MTLTNRTVEVRRDFLKEVTGCSCAPPNEACDDCSPLKRRWSE